MNDTQPGFIRIEVEAEEEEEEEEEEERATLDAVHSLQTSYSREHRVTVGASPSALTPVSHVTMSGSQLRPRPPPWAQGEKASGGTWLSCPATRASLCTVRMRTWLLRTHGNAEQNQNQGVRTGPSAGVLYPRVPAAPPPGDKAGRPTADGQLTLTTVPPTAHPFHGVCVQC